MTLSLKRLNKFLAFSAGDVEPYLNLKTRNFRYSSKRYYLFSIYIVLWIRKEGM